MRKPGIILKGEPVNAKSDNFFITSEQALTPPIRTVPKICTLKFDRKTLFLKIQYKICNINFWIENDPHVVQKDIQFGIHRLPFKFPYFKNVTLDIFETIHFHFLLIPSSSNIGSGNSLRWVRTTLKPRLNWTTLGSGCQVKMLIRVTCIVSSALTNKNSSVRFGVFWNNRQLIGICLWEGCHHYTPLLGAADNRDPCMASQGLEWHPTIAGRWRSWDICDLN